MGKRFALGWIRTNDNPLRRRGLYPLSYERPSPHRTRDIRLADIPGVSAAALVHYNPGPINSRNMLPETRAVAGVLNHELV